MVRTPGPLGNSEIMSIPTLKRSSAIIYLDTGLKFGESSHFHVSETRPWWLLKHLEYKMAEERCNVGILRNWNAKWPWRSHHWKTNQGYLSHISTFHRETVNVNYHVIQNSGTNPHNGYAWRTMHDMLSNPDKYSWNGKESSIDWYGLNLEIKWACVYLWSLHGFNEFKSAVLECKFLDAILRRTAIE